LIRQHGNVLRSTSAQLDPQLTGDIGTG